MVRRVAFFSGLILGSGLCAWVLGSALIYFFTGKVPALVIDGEKGIRAKLLDLDALHEAPVEIDKE